MFGQKQRKSSGFPAFSRSAWSKKIPAFSWAVSSPLRIRETVEIERPKVLFKDFFSIDETTDLFFVDRFNCTISDSLRQDTVAYEQIRLKEVRVNVPKVYIGDRNYIFEGFQVTFSWRVTFGTEIESKITKRAASNTLDKVGIDKKSSKFPSFIIKPQSKWADKAPSTAEGSEIINVNKGKSKDTDEDYDYWGGLSPDARANVTGSPDIVEGNFSVELQPVESTSYPGAIWDDEQGRAYFPGPDGSKNWIIE